VFWDGVETLSTPVLRKTDPSESSVRLRASGSPRLIGALQCLRGLTCLAAPSSPHLTGVVAGFPFSIT
jgi:hypothetical protein